jgi:hypothetical protein
VARRGCLIHMLVVPQLLDLFLKQPLLALDERQLSGHRPLRNRRSPSGLRERLAVCLQRAKLADIRPIRARYGVGQP